MLYFALFNLFLALATTSNLVNGDDRPRALRPKKSERRNAVIDEVHDEVAVIAEAFRALAGTSDPTMSLSLTDSPSGEPSDSPSSVPSVSSAPTTVAAAPSAAPSMTPSANATESPTKSPSTVPSFYPSVVPTNPGPVSLTAAPVTDTNQTCPGMSEEERVLQILAKLDEVANPDDIRDVSTPQGKATAWILEEDEFNVCPDDDCQFIQRWALAVIYFSTNGDDWFECSANPLASDPCGTVRPFRGKERFLSSGSMCNWAGIKCNIQGCVTEIEFEENNLVGTIATEIGLLPDLIIWGMERGTLTSTIPTEVGRLTNLIFIDLDFNELTGSITSELLSLSLLTQLDLNDNKMTGSINGIGVFPDMEFLQLHNNNFSGTVPEALGTYSDMTAFTLHGTSIKGTMPESVCNLRAPSGVLTSLIADCKPGVGGVAPDIRCDCCSDCRAEIPATRP